MTIRCRKVLKRKKKINYDDVVHETRRRYNKTNEKSSRIYLRYLNDPRRQVFVFIFKSGTALIDEPA